MNDVPEDVAQTVDEAVERMREDWLSQIRWLADVNDNLAASIDRRDEACADSMRFCATRLRRVADREEGKDTDDDE
jgi:hypothetical protein